jgi:hypothetical protein
MKKIKPSDLEAEAQRLIATGQMPSFEELSAVIVEVREKYRDQILAARKMGEDGEN